jgi:hypothetical protein
MDTLQATLLQIRLAEPRIGLLLGSLDTPVANDSQSKSSRIDELKKKYNNSSECD